MKPLDRRRRIAVIAGGLASTGGLSGLIGHHSADADTGHRYWLLGLSVGLTVGVMVLLVSKMRAAERD